MSRISLIAFRLSFEMCTLADSPQEILRVGVIDKILRLPKCGYSIGISKEINDHLSAGLSGAIGEIDLQVEVYGIFIVKLVGGSRAGCTIKPISHGDDS